MHAADLPPAVRIREVGPRDGLQAEEPVPVAGRAALVHALAAAGCADIEVCSFVSPKAVPAMAGGAEVVAAVGPLEGVRRWALVPNDRGAALALDAGVDAVTATVSASEAYSQKNTHRSMAETIEALPGIVAAAGGLPVDVVVSCAFGSPWEGDIPPADVVRVGRAALDAGASAVTFADTTGMALPDRLERLLTAWGTVVGVGLHLHDTRGTALVTAYRALQLGVSRFDTALGGLGGSPFAAGAGGNLATEDLVHLCDGVGVATGIDLDGVLAAVGVVEDLLTHAVPGRIARHGPRTRGVG
jgi:hydroxymethylglutaryl-CoA lyase